MGISSQIHGPGKRPKTRTIVFYLSDLEDPVVLTEFSGTTAATDHNLYLRGQYLYQSADAEGLRKQAGDGIGLVGRLPVPEA